MILSPEVVVLEPASADVIIAGILLTREVMALFGCDQLIVSDGGLREGILLYHLAQRKHRSQAD